MEWLWAVLLKVFFLFAFYLFVAFCHIAVAKWLPDGRFKQALLKERGLRRARR